MLIRKQGIQPVAFASSEQDRTRLASNALDYESDNVFAPKFQNKTQYWAVDFATNVSLKSYQIKSSPILNEFNNWQFHSSLDNITWTPATQKETGYPRNNTYLFNRIIIARYARLDAGSNGNDKTWFKIFHVKFFGVSQNVQYSFNGRKIIDFVLLLMILFVTS